MRPRPTRRMYLVKLEQEADEIVGRMLAVVRCEPTNASPGLAPDGHAEDEPVRAAAQRIASRRRQRPCAGDQV